MSVLALFIILLAVGEVGTGGLVTANVAGAGAAAGGAAWREVAGSAKASYASRAAKLQESAIGRWRLRTEAKAGNAALKAQAAMAGLARSGGRAVVAGWRAAPDGAAKGRQVRQSAIEAAKTKARHAWEVAAGERPTAKAERLAAAGRCMWATGRLRGRYCGKPVDPESTAYLCTEHATEEGEFPEPSGEGDQTGTPPQTPCSCGAPVEYGFTDCAKCGAGNLAAAEQFRTEIDPMLVRAAEVQAERDRLDGTPQMALPKTTAPEVPAGEGATMSTQVSPEDKGAAPYVQGWDSEEGGLEYIVSDLTAKRDALSAFAEANRRHEVGGVEDVIGAYSAAIAAMQAVGEKHGAHVAKLHQAHDGALEATSGSDVQSHQDYAGAR